ncbi:protein phosphatase [Enemella dayhoffiae]|uniref:Protein phosphatase n=1 Tax=Enemella dayhoffiae TaxID=2016507 RepID=A0A255HB30_9ACTN|nr:protein-tyrosine phosphatase family protein [Enemella dayhoffiae]OYO25078.1 protein phosphatase [Enemella dayhoffiae]
MTTWGPGPGVLELPSGRRVRGRSIRANPAPPADFTLYLLTFPPRNEESAYAWLSWPDFWLPTDPGRARALITEAYARSATERVEVCCGGGVGRTGTVLACFAVLDGLTPEEALAHVRRHYHPRATETPWQRRFLSRFTTHPAA